MILVTTTTTTIITPVMCKVLRSQTAQNQPGTNLRPVWSVASLIQGWGAPEVGEQQASVGWTPDTAEQGCGPRMPIPALRLRGACWPSTSPIKAQSVHIRPVPGDREGEGRDRTLGLPGTAQGTDFLRSHDIPQHSKGMTINPTPQTRALKPSEVR